jgi:hypothetical protein
MSSDIPTPMTQLPDGRWVPATPIGPQGVVAKVEFWLREHHRLPRLVRLLAWVDELGLR